MTFVASVRDFAVRWGALIVLVIVWQFVTQRAGAIYFPPPSTIAGAMHALWFSGPPAHAFLSPAVAHDVVPSLVRMLSGYGIAAAVGIVVGAILGRSRVAFELANPTLQFVRSIPGPALVPVFLVLLGTGSSMRVTLIAFGSVWPILLNTVDGMRAVDATQLDTARAFGLPPLARMRWLYLPAALPRICAGLRIAVSLALILMVVSEFVAANDGIGHAIAAAEHVYLIPDMWAGIILVGILGYALNHVFVRIENRLLRWHVGARQRVPL